MDPLTKDHCEMTADDIDDRDIETFDDEEPLRRDMSEEQVDGGNRDYI